VKKERPADAPYPGAVKTDVVPEVEAEPEVVADEAPTEEAAVHDAEAPVEQSASEENKE
jgi:hypothetical protein